MAGLLSVAQGVQAALLLAWGRAEGLRFLEPGLEGARRSFWAGALCLPLFVALHLTDAAGDPAARAEGLLSHGFAAELLGYVIGWAGFALLSRPLADMLGRAERWPRYIAAWNWCNVAQYVLLLAGSLPGVLGAPPWAQQAAALISLGWALWLEWYAARLTLDITGLQAAAMTGMDLLLGEAVAMLVTSFH